MLRFLPLVSSFLSCILAQSSSGDNTFPLTRHQIGPFYNFLSMKSFFSYSKDIRTPKRSRNPARWYRLLYLSLLNIPQHNSSSLVLRRKTIGRVWWCRVQLSRCLRGWNTGDQECWLLSQWEIFLQDYNWGQSCNFVLHCSLQWILDRSCAVKASKADSKWQEGEATDHTSSLVHNCDQRRSDCPGLLGCWLSSSNIFLVQRWRKAVTGPW